MAAPGGLAVCLLAVCLLAPSCGDGGGSAGDAGGGLDAAVTRDGSSGRDAGATLDSAVGGDASSGQDAQPAPLLHSMSPAELDAALQSKDFLLINVHVPDQGEIPGTDTHIPYTDVDAIAAYLGSDLGVKTVIYCLTDHMALIAGPALVQRGYWNVAYLEGGMSAWQAAGYPVDPYP